jgi:hypothetical protein
MHDAPLPLGAVLLLDILFPPVGAALVWLISRRGADLFQGGNPSKRSLAGLKRSFWVQLIFVYCLMFGITGYAYFFR